MYDSDNTQRVHLSYVPTEKKYTHNYTLYTPFYVDFVVYNLDQHIFEYDASEYASDLFSPPLLIAVF